MRPGVLLSAARAERLPVPREVAVQVDTATVLPSAGGYAVGVQVLDQPQVDPRRRRVTRQAPRHRDSCGFVAVNAADNQHLAARVRVPHLECADRAAARRAAEPNPVDDRRGERTGHCRPPLGVAGVRDMRVSTGERAHAGQDDDHAQTRADELCHGPELPGQELTRT
jgi:hypothetical protein